MPEWDPSPFRENSTVVQIVLACALIMSLYYKIKVLANCPNQYGSHLSNPSDGDRHVNMFLLVKGTRRSWLELSTE